MSKKPHAKKNNVNLNLPVSPEYVEKFTKLSTGQTVTLQDDKSDAKAQLSIRATNDSVYYVRPDGELIPEIPKQKKADFLIFCTESQQANFIEMKGRNINTSQKDSPYAQILGTLDYFSKTEGLKKLVDPAVDKHAFIVSPLKQKVPSGIDKAERTLILRLASGSTRGYKVREYLHYVRYIPNTKYSDKNGHIICSSIAPLTFPYKKPNKDNEGN